MFLSMSDIMYQVGSLQVKTDSNVYSDLKIITGMQHTDVQQTIRKMEQMGKAPLQGKKTPLGAMKLGGSLLVKDPSKATEECNICGFKSTIKGIRFGSYLHTAFNENAFSQIRYL